MSRSRWFPRLAVVAAPVLALATLLPTASASLPVSSALGAASASPTATTPPRPTATRVLTGLVSPVLVRSAKDGTSRLFVVEQAGRVRVVSGARITGTYLDIRSLVRAGGEQGLLGLAFAPDFATSHRLWVTYTRGDGALVLARFSTASASSPRVIASSRRTVLVVPHPKNTNHNGGNIAFGPDGYLYLGTGDGGGGGDPANNAQNLRSLLGKMLRIDVRCSGHAYCSPATNPWSRSTRYRHEIWMWGLRNPWRWSFDTNGAIWVGDVGQYKYEEIDAIPRSSQRGANLGWSCREAKHVYDASRCNSRSHYRAPTLEICHVDLSGCPALRGAEAIIGGFVYRGSTTPAARGTYVYGDYVTGRLWSFRSSTLSAPKALPGVSGFGVDDRGEIFAVTLGGGLYRIGFTGP